jgi:hypothetical protein
MGGGHGYGIYGSQYLSTHIIVLSFFSSVAENEHYRHDFGAIWFVVAVAVVVVVCSVRPTSFWNSVKKNQKSLKKTILKPVVVVYAYVHHPGMFTHYYRCGAVCSLLNSATHQSLAAGFVSLGWAFLRLSRAFCYTLYSKKHIRSNELTHVLRKCFEHWPRIA